MRKYLTYPLVNTYWPLLIILCASFILFTINLGRDLLTDWDECVYAQQAVEMKQSGNFLINQWNHQIVFEKPPLYNIMMQPFYWIGQNEFTARLYTVILGLFLIAALYIFCQKYFSRAVAVLSSLILLGTPLTVIYIKHVNTDIGFTLFTFLGFVCWTVAQKKGNYSYLAGVFFGLAAMNKGLSVVAYLIALCIAMLITFKRDSLTNYIKMSITFLATMLPWHLYMYAIYGQRFWHVYFEEHIIQRSKYPIDFHVEGRLFYLKGLISNFTLWLIALFVSPFYLYIHKNELTSIKKIQKFATRHIIIITIVLMIVIPLASITKVATRIAWYAMPIYPFVAILLAVSINWLASKFQVKYLMFVSIVISSALALRTISNETGPFNFTRSIDPRYATLIKASELTDKELNYLVWHGERAGEAVQPKELRTSTTFVYGGNPCAVYYSKKKVNYFYSVPKFQQTATTEAGLYMVELGDELDMGFIPKQEIFKNKDYFLFRTKGAK